jgi:hypothetical protein
VVGFLKQAGGEFDLGPVSIRSENEYASVLVVPMDAKAVAESTRLLVQVGTICWPTGWQTKPTTYKHKGREIQGRRIVSTGKMPYRFAATRVEISLANPNITKATRLDAMGFADGDVPIRRLDGKLSVKMPSDTLYMILSAK